MQNKKILLASVLALVVVVGGWWYLSGNMPENKTMNSVNNSTLTETEIAGLMAMREEEKLAHDVYKTLEEKWGTRIFTNISGSEAVHTRRVKDLLDKYNLPDPVDDKVNGQFKNQAVQDLYNLLVAKGETSLVAALEVGVTIEEMDIKDLQEKMKETTNQEILNTYQNLLNGSENHLRAFKSNLEKRN